MPAQMCIPPSESALSFISIPTLLSFPLSQARHFASACLEGSNIGPGVVALLLEAGLVEDVSDFFTLTEVCVGRGGLPSVGGSQDGNKALCMHACTGAVS